MILGLSLSALALFWIVFVYVHGPGAIWSEKIKAANRRMP